MIPLLVLILVAFVGGVRSDGPAKPRSTALLGGALVVAAALSTVRFS